MEKQKEDVKHKQNRLMNLESQKIEYENMNQDIDWQIQELKDKKKKIEEKMDCYMEKIDKFRHYPNEFENQWKGEVYNQMTQWFWKSNDVDYAWIVFYQIDDVVDAITRKIEELKNQKIDNTAILLGFISDMNTLKNEIKILLS